MGGAKIADRSSDFIIFLALSVEGVPNFIAISFLRNQLFCVVSGPGSAGVYVCVRVYGGGPPCLIMLKVVGGGSIIINSNPSLDWAWRLLGPNPFYQQNTRKWYDRCESP